jgi:hypothetical protein
MISKNHFFIGIDFSINSPGICIIHDSKPRWISISQGPKTKAEHVFIKKLTDCNDVEYMLFQTDSSQQASIDDYSNNEYHKITKYISRAGLICEVINSSLTGIGFGLNTTDIAHFAFEGFSYGSNTNNIIDIAIATGFLKSKLIESYDKMTLDVMAPGTIKKHAGSGRYKKKDMYNVFVENRHSDDSLIESGFWLLCQSQLGNSKLLKPTDDLIDSYFVAHSLLAKYSGLEKPVKSSKRSKPGKDL